MRRSVLTPRGARRPDVPMQMIGARVLARSAYSQGARDQADLARQVWWPDVVLLTISSALDRHFGATPIALWPRIRGHPVAHKERPDRSIPRASAGPGSSGHPLRRVG
jgi:hypothetical protein